MKRPEPDTFRSAHGLYVPKRRTPTRILLADRQVLDAECYVDVHGADGGPGRVVDRLCDTAERFMPVAVEDRHVLVNKSMIVHVTVLDNPHEVRPVEHADVMEWTLCFRMAVGGDVTGVVTAERTQEGVRPLDFLNTNPSPFIAVLAAGTPVVLNAARIVGVTERAAPMGPRGVD